MEQTTIAGSCRPGEANPRRRSPFRPRCATLSAEHWLRVLDLVPSGSLTDERQIGFVASGFEHVPRDPDPQEVLRVKRIRYSEALDLALDGSIRDAGTVAMLTAVQVRALGGALPFELVDRIIHK